MLDRLKRDGWVPYAKSIGTAAVAAVVLAVSAVRLVALAESCHIDTTLSWTLPVALDVGGGVATIIWTKNSGPAATWGMCIALLSLAESLAGNILSDLIQADLLAVTPQLIIGVGAVYPITLFLMIHLLVQSGGKQRAARPAVRPEPKRAETTREPAKADIPKPAVETSERKQIEQHHPTVVDITDVIPKREQGRRYVLAQRAAGRPANDITAAEVDRAIKASSYSKKFIKDWLAEPLDTAGTAAAGN
jgi:hypothetical protein